jgi:hypothetical protein
MKAQLLKRQEIDINAWDALAAESPQGSIFVRSWYMDAAAPGWQGITVYDEKRELCAIFPLFISRKYFIDYALQPMFTKYWGVCFANKLHKTCYEEYSWKKKILEAAIAAIPSSIKIFSYNFHPTFDYALPFHWESYKLETKYTFTIDLQPVYEDIFKSFPDHNRKEINKARKNGILIKEDFEIQPVLEILDKNAAGGKVMLSKKYYPVLEKIYTACKANNACYILSAYSVEGQLLASALQLYSNNTNYSLVNNSDPAVRALFPMQLLTAEIIRKAQQHADTFDFLGLMMKNLEFFYRKFGPKPVPYLNISKNKIPLLPL